MDKDFSELIEYLDGKFEKIDDRFEKIDDRFEKIDDRFEKIDVRFEKIDDRFEKIDGQFLMVSRELGDIKENLQALEDHKADKSDINDLMTAVDAYAKKADTYFQEMVMLAHKVDRHEKWMHQLADKLGVKLEY